MRNTVFIAVALALVAGACLWWAQPSWFPLPQSGGVACTMEAKQCPDGSYVGRQGPNCEFAACPAASTSATVSARIGQAVSALDVALTPEALLEDSRCPVDVQCIQAGTVRMRAELRSGLGTAKQVFILNQPITTEVEIVTLVAVSPEPHSGQTIAAGDYIFTFEIKKR